MAKKYEFKPDKPVSGFFSKLFLTQKQRRALLKWSLYGLVLLLLSVLQDVILCRFRLFGATTELVPCGIFLICVIEGLERGSIFSLCAACLYLFSGTAAGNYSIVFITALSVGIAFFRQSYLQEGFSAAMLCTAAGMILYELAVFFIGLFLSLTTLSRISTPFLTALLTLIAAPALYPVLQTIRSIGGNTWKE